MIDVALGGIFFLCTDIFFTSGEKHTILLVFVEIKSSYLIFSGTSFDFQDAKLVEPKLKHTNSSPRGKDNPWGYGKM
jgi:hypothetical protein